MAVDLRRYSTVGIAVASAGIIAISPLTVPPPELHLPAATSVVSTRTVDLTAFVNPLAAWGDVLTTTAGDIGALGQMIAADPFPIVRQIVANQVSYVQEIVSIGRLMGNNFVNWANGAPGKLQTAFQQLASGQFAAGVDGLYALPLGGLLSVMFPLLQFDIPKRIAQNVTNVIGSLSSVGIQLALGALGVAYSAEQAFSNTGQQFLDAVKTGDAATAVSAVINFPATMVNAVLNGYGPSKGMGGIFGRSGFVTSVIRALKVIADAITPPAPATPLAAKVDDLAAAGADTAVKALTPATKPAATAAVKTGAAEKVSASPVKAKDSVTKEDSKPAVALSAAVDAPDAKPDTAAPKVDTPTSAAEPSSSDPAKVETTKPVHRDSTKAVPGGKHGDSSEPKSAGAGTSGSSSDDKPKASAPSVDTDSAVKPAKPAAKNGKQTKKVSSTHQSANAG